MITVYSAWWQRRAGASARGDTPRTARTRHGARRPQRAARREAGAATHTGTRVSVHTVDSLTDTTLFLYPTPHTRAPSCEFGAAGTRVGSAASPASAGRVDRALVSLKVGEELLQKRALHERFIHSSFTTAMSGEEPDVVQHISFQKTSTRPTRTHDGFVFRAALAGRVDRRVPAAPACDGPTRGR